MIISQTPNITVIASGRRKEREQAMRSWHYEHKQKNFNELVVFYNEELPQKFKREIDKLDGVQFFQAIYDLFKAAQGENMQEGKAYAREEERNLPKEVLGNGVSSSANARNQSVMARF